MRFGWTKSTGKKPGRLTAEAIHYDGRNSTDEKDTLLGGKPVPGLRKPEGNDEDPTPDFRMINEIQPGERGKKSAELKRHQKGGIDHLPRNLFRR